MDGASGRSGSEQVASCTGGLAQEVEPLFARFPGVPRCGSRWEPGSYGYHGDDGRKFFQQGQGEEYGPRFGQGDVVGAGIHLGKGEMFFT